MSLAGERIIAESGGQPGGRQGGHALASVAAVLAVTAVWQASGWLGLIGPTILPTPLEVLETARELAETGCRQVPL